VNAVCIDQSNAEEKGGQVSIMADIYKQSRETQVWLGEETGSAPSLRDLPLIDKIQISLLARERGLEVGFRSSGNPLAHHLRDITIYEEKTRRILQN
jgi:hypothetical protein